MGAQGIVVGVDNHAATRTKMFDERGDQKRLAAGKCEFEWRDDIQIEVRSRLLPESNFNLAHDHAFRFTIICLISPMASAGFNPLGQTWAQFMMVWQR